MRDLNGQVAWVTGAGSGIGASAALALAGAGMQLVLSDREEEGVKRVAAQIAERGGRVRIAPLDVTDARAVQKEFCQAVNTDSSQVSLPDLLWGICFGTCHGHEEKRRGL